MTDPLTLTYPDIAAKLGVQLCDHDCALRSLESHRRGYVTGDGIVHWKDRGLTRRGLYTFLKLVARRNAWHDSPGMSRAELLWYMASQAYRLGLTVGVRFPREFADTDRAQVREELDRASVDDELHRKIERWAHEAPG